MLASVAVFRGPWNNSLYSGTKKEHKPKLLSPDIFRWGRGLPREGVGAKSSVCPSKPGKSNFLGGISRDFAGISQGRPKSLRKEKFVFNSRPLFTETGLEFPSEFLSYLSRTVPAKAEGPIAREQLGSRFALL